MSLNRFGKKTLTGEDDLEVDRINIVGEGIGINSNFGNAGQFLKKSSVDNSLEYGAETSYSASLPIILSGTNFKFDDSNPTTNKICIQTDGTGKKTFSIGTGIKFQENTNLIITDNINLNNQLVIYDGLTAELDIDKDGFSVGGSNTNFFIGQNLTPINDIFVNNLTIKNLLNLVSSSITLDSGNITLTDGNLLITNGTFVMGSGDFTIGGDIDCGLIESSVQSVFTNGIKQTISGGNFSISNLGVIQGTSAILGALTLNGTLSMSSNDVSCKAIQLSGGVGSGLDMNNTQLINPSKIVMKTGLSGTGLDMGNLDIINMNDIVGTGYANTNSQINNIFTIYSRHIYSPQFGVYSDTGFGNLKLLIDGGSDTIVGSDSTTISGIDKITLSSGTGDGFDLNGKNIVNINNFTIKSGGTGIDMNSNPIINCKSLTITNGGINMNDSSITNIDAIGFKATGSGADMNGTAIIDIGGISLKSGGSGIDMNNTNITEVNSITCSTINLSGEISNSNIPATISGNKTFSGNTTFSAGMGADINMNSFDLTSVGDITTISGNITSSGDINANGNIIGDGSTEIKNCLFVDETNTYVPPDCYYGTNSAISTPHFVKYILPQNFMPDDDNSDNRYTLSDINTGAGRNMGTSTQLFTQFTIPQGFRWIGYRVYITNSSRVVYTGSGVSTFFSRPMLRKNWIAGKFEFEDMSSGGFDSSLTTYGTTNGTFHYMVNKPSAGWFNGYNTNRPSGVWTGMIQLLKSGGFTNAYYVQGAEVFFEKEDYSAFNICSVSNSTMVYGLSSLNFFIDGKPTGYDAKVFNSGTTKTFKNSDFGVGGLNLNQAYPITITTSSGGTINKTFNFSSPIGCSLSHTSWNGDNSNPRTITFTEPQSQFSWSV